MFRILSLLAIFAIAPGCAWLTDYQYEPAGKSASAKPATPAPAPEPVATAAPGPAPIANTLNNDDVYLIEHEGRLHVFDDVVDQGVVARFLGCHEAVTVRVLLDFLERVARVTNQNFVETLFHSPEFVGMDQYVFRSALHAGQRLVNHYPGVGQRVAFASGASG